MAWTWPSLRIWAVAALLAAVGSAASTWQILASRDVHMFAARQLALSLSNAAAQRIGGSLRSMDVLLAEAAEKITDPMVNDADLLANLRTRLSAFPELDSIALIDTNGILRQIAYRGGNARKVPVDVSGGSHVRFQRDHWAEDELFITPPLTDRFTGHTIILLSRPILGADHSFRGIAAMAVMTDFIDQTLESVVQEDGAAAGSFSTDGILYSRFPRDDRFVGKSIQDSALFQAFDAVGGQGTHDQAASFSDGVERIVGFSPVPHYPVIAAVGVNRGTVMEHWRQEIWVHGGIQALFVAVIFTMARRLSRSEQYRRSVTEQLLATERAHVESLSQAVTERTAELKESLAALGESEERFRRIVEISPLPLVLSRRATGRVVYINAGAAEAFGIPLDQAVDQALPDYWANPADREAMLVQLAEDGLIRNREVLLKRASGEHFTALLSAATVTLQGEDLVLVSVLDITERKRLEDELGRSNRDLEQFSYAVSHDLQEPLRMVSSYLTLLERRYADKLDGEAHEFIAFAVDGAQRMARMITDLLDYSRVHRRGNQFTNVALDQVLSDALANLSTAIATSQAQVTFAALPVVFGDASQLMRVFQNVIGNALKYRAADTAPHITVTVTKSAGEWIIAVTDNGIGIDPTHTGRLFQIFQRLHARGSYEGSGVGLALCRRIMERHHGRIWVESAGEGLGSTFYFTFPVTVPAQVEAAV